MTQLSKLLGGMRKFAGALLCILAIMLASSNIFAHARLVRSQPDANSNLKQAPKRIELWFSEELEQNLSTIVVTNTSGKQIDKKNATLSEGGKKLQIDLDDLSGGTYTVDWKAVSTDGHTMKGKFTFSVAIAEQSPVNATSSAASKTSEKPSDEHKNVPAQVKQSAATLNASPQTAGAMEESGSNWSQSVVRWFAYLAMVLLFGGFAFQLFVLSPGLRHARSINESAKEAAAINKGTRRLVSVMGISIVVLTLTALIQLMLETFSIFDQNTGNVLTLQHLGQIINGTSFGRSWRLEILCLAVIIVITILLGSRLKANASGEHRSLYWAGLMASILLLLAPSLTGHSIAAAKEFRFSVPSDWLHLLSVAAWAGGLFYLVLMLPTVLSQFKDAERIRILNQLIPRFTRLATVCVIALLLTGVYNSWTHIDSFSQLWGTTYGEILLLKVLLVMPMLALGALNNFVMSPRVERLAAQEEGRFETPEYQQLEREFFRSVTIEAALGIVVLSIASVLVFQPPARLHPMDMTGNVSPDRTSRQEIRTL